jgi:hypothetical protein
LRSCERRIRGLQGAAGREKRRGRGGTRLVQYSGGLVVWWWEMFFPEK